MNGAVEYKGVPIDKLVWVSACLLLRHVYEATSQLDVVVIYKTILILDVKGSN